MAAPQLSVLGKLPSSYERGLKARVLLQHTSKTFSESLASGSRQRHADRVSSSQQQQQQQQQQPHLPSRSLRERDNDQSTRMRETGIEAEDLVQAPFSPLQFIFSFICELLPAFTIAPIFIILCYGWKKGINVASHRTLSLYCPSKDPKVRTSTRQLLKTTFSVTLMMYWNWAAVIVFLIYHHELRKDGIDYVELVIFIAPPILRSLVVAMKYSFFTAQEIADMGGADTWDASRSSEKMLLASWAVRPLFYPNLLQREIDLATLQADCDLNKVNFRLHRGEASESPDEHRDVSAMSVLSRVVHSKFGSPMSKNVNSKTVLLGQLLVTSVPALARLACGREPFGSSWQSHLFLIVAFVSNFFMGSITYLFLTCAYHDFRRRTNASKMMSALVTYPGLPLRDFLDDDGKVFGNEGVLDNVITGDTLRRLGPEKEKGSTAEESVTGLYRIFGFKSDAKPRTDAGRPSLQPAGRSPLDGFVEKVFFDIRDPSNAYAWLLARRVLRTTGAMYYDRCKIFVGFYFVMSALFLLILNVEVWTNVEHFVFGSVQLVVYTAFITIGFGLASHESAAMQATVAPDRLMLKRETMLIEKEIIDISAEIGESKRAKKQTETEERHLQELYDYKDLLSQSVNFLRSGDELISYEEGIYAPREILGHVADKAIVHTVIGAIMSMAFMAYQGLTQNSGSYNSSGQYMYI